ncbi:MAG: PspC domain-containing protein [Bacteroidales bacterium]|nr:PspC domain-containing protein [Bacteroidales bacterium]
MEKTLTINISGWVFNINEDAYKKLTEYFKNLKAYFKKQQGGDEIVSDIESRIAELFKEKSQEQDVVIDIASVEAIMKTMGQPYQMEEDDEDDSDYQQANTHSKSRKKLFRDPINAHIGGVSSGLGQYINLDPIIIRILFVFLLLPGGLGIILYAILWILIPEASTTSDRIRMEGKKVNVENIENKVREEATYLKERLSDFSEEAIDVYKKTGPARRYGLKRLESFFQSLGKITLRILKFLLGLILFINGVGLLIGFSMFFFNWIPGLHFDTFFVNGMSLPSFLNSYIFDSKYTVITLISLTVVVLIPIIMLIFHGFRFLFNIKRNKMLGTIAWQSWVVALIISLGMSYSTIRAYKSHAMEITSHHFEQVQSDTLHIKLNTASYYQNVLSSDQKTIISQDFNFPILHDNQFYGEPKLEILNSDKHDFEMKLYRSANGKDEEEANKNIQKLRYTFDIDSTGIILDPYYTLLANEKWRNQDVVLKLYIPTGKAISIDRNLRKHLRLRYFWRDKLYANKENTSYWIANEDSFVKEITVKNHQDEMINDSIIVVDTVQTTISE